MGIVINQSAKNKSLDEFEKYQIDELRFSVKSSIISGLISKLTNDTF